MRSPHNDRGRQPDLVWCLGKARFTLIELLVVISIIAILASFLLPSIQMAKTKAMVAICQNNLKQFALVTQMYADDFDDRIPAPWNCGYAHLAHNQWSGLKPMGVGTYFRAGYMTEPVSGICPDNKNKDIKKMLTGLKSLMSTGQFPSDASTYSKSTGYVVNMPFTGIKLSEGQAALQWVNYIDYYDRKGIASTLRGNMPGGREIRTTMLRTIRKPRALIACSFSDQYWTYQPHQYTCVNVMYADGYVGNYKTSPGHPLQTETLSTTEKFRDRLNGAHP